MIPPKTTAGNKIKKMESEGYHFEAADGTFRLIVQHIMGKSSEPFTVKGFRVIEEQRENGEIFSEATIKVEEGDEFEQFFLYTLFNEEGELIDIKILDYQSEYGYEVTSKWWLKQFTKKWGQHFEYSKNIDAISGATVSVKSMIREMNMLQEVMKKQ